MAKTEYLRLTRSRQRAALAVFTADRFSLWLGGDHLLCVINTGYAETYKRFYFRDIQAIQVRGTQRWKYLILVYGFLTMILAGIAFAAGGDVGSWIFGVLAGLSLLGFSVHVALGPSCATYLRTAVQTEHLVSLSRWRRTHRILDRLRPLIAAAQGTVSREEIPTRLREWEAAETTAATSTPAPAGNYLVDDPNAPPRIIS